MAYIYKKQIGKKNYYYLRISERKGARVIAKDIAYLGNSIQEVKKSIHNLPKYKELIRKGYKTINTYIESNYYLEKIINLKLKKDEFLLNKLNNIEACKFHYNSLFLKNDRLTKNQIFKDFIIEFAFNTTSIEGNTITLKQARNLLEDNLTPSNKSLREIYDLQNTKKVFFDILDKNETLSHNFIINIHKGLMKNIDSRTGYRTVDVRVYKSNFDVTPAIYIKDDLNLLFKWYNKNKNKLHPFVLAIIFHHKFEKIHPFMDGNGRTGRVIMNYILLQNKYPPIMIHNKFRKEYLNALRVADKSNINDAKQKDYFKLISFVADEMYYSYWQIFL